MNLYWLSKTAWILQTKYHRRIYFCYFLVRINITFFPSKWLICWVLGRERTNNKCEKDLNVKLILSGNYLISIRILFSCLSYESAYTDKPKIRFNLSSQGILKVVIIWYIYMWIWLEVLFLPFVKRFKVRIKLSDKTNRYLMPKVTHYMV